jgi:hypothetical protein
MSCRSPTLMPRVQAIAPMSSALLMVRIAKFLGDSQDRPADADHCGFAHEVGVVFGFGCLEVLNCASFVVVGGFDADAGAPARFRRRVASVSAVECVALGVDMESAGIAAAGKLLAPPVTRFGMGCAYSGCSVFVSRSLLCVRVCG